MRPAALIELADIRPGMTLLEPSAGTGALVRAIPAGAHVVAVELVANLARALGYTTQMFAAATSWP